MAGPCVACTGEGANLSRPGFPCPRCLGTRTDPDPSAPDDVEPLPWVLSDLAERFPQIEREEMITDGHALGA